MGTWLAIGFGILAYLAAIGGVIALATRAARRRAQDRCNSLVEVLCADGAELRTVRRRPDLFSSAESELRHGETTIRVVTRPYTKHSSKLCLRIPCGPLPAISLGREDQLAVAGKRLGLTREVETGDAAFDRAVFVDSAEADDVVLAALGAPAARAGIGRLLELGYQLETSKEGLEAYRVVPTLGEVPPMPEAPEVGSILSALVRNLPALDPSRFARPSSPRTAALVVVLSLLAVSGPLLGGAGVTWFARMLDGSAILAALLIGVGAWGAVLPGIYLALRGRSDSHRIFLIAFLLSAISVPWGCASLAAILNQVLDEGRAVPHRVTVRSIRHGRGLDQVHVESWREAGRAERISVAKGRLGTAKPGDAIGIRVRPGWLGWAWVELEPW